ncbi:DUF1700 domain-containing protein [Lachnospiraceae bacterium LCP25S3_G4]
MSRIEFMSSLGALLQDISVEEREEVLQYYNDYFDDAGEENEQHVIEELGSPQKVAVTIKVGLRGRDDEASEYGETGYTDTRFEQKENPMNPKEADYHSTQPKTNKTLKIILIIAIIVIGGPIVIPLACGIFATLVAMLIAIVVFFAGLMVAAISIMIAGIVVFCVGLTQMIATLPVGLLLSGVGMVLFVLGMVGTVLMVKAAVVAFPAVFRGVVWLCRKPFEKRGAVA